MTRNIPKCAYDTIELLLSTCTDVFLKSYHIFTLSGHVTNSVVVICQLEVSEWEMAGWTGCHWEVNVYICVQVLRISSLKDGYVITVYYPVMGTNVNVEPKLGGWWHRVPKVVHGKIVPWLYCLCLDCLLNISYLIYIRAETKGC